MNISKLQNLLPKGLQSQNYLNSLFLFSILLIFIINVYSFRSIYTNEYDKDYMYDLYYQSQWVIPNSPTPISDNTLYQVAGYDLVTTNRFYTINPEVPVLGKYLYGWSILTFNNAETISIILFLTALLLFAYLAHLVIKKKPYVFLCVFLFVTEPLLIDQMRFSMLDLPQLITLLIHVIALIKFLQIAEKGRGISKEKLMYTIIMGISLGAFVSIKIGLWAAAIVFIDLIMLYKKERFNTLWYIMIWGVVSGMFYTLTYAMFFLQGNTLIDFLKAQKWMVHFYMISEAQPVFGAVATTLLFGFIKGWHENAQWERVEHWNIMWPVYTLILIKYVYSSFRNALGDDVKYLALLTAALLGMYSFVPFFARYLVLGIPLMIVLLGKYISERKINKEVFIIVITIYFLQYINYLQ